MTVSPVDLLVFGPHPDDLEIGMGGTVAHHVASGLSVGLCDLTRGEMGTNGTPEEREREAEEARVVLGAAWRVNLGLPDRQLREAPEQVRPIVELIRRCRPAAIALPHWADRHPDHVAAYTLVSAAAFAAACAATTRQARRGSPTGSSYYFINTSVEAIVRDRRLRPVRGQTARARLSRTQFAPADADARTTRLTSPLFQQLIESRDAQFGAPRRRPVGGRVRRSRAAW